MAKKASLLAMAVIILMTTSVFALVVTDNGSDSRNSTYGLTDYTGWIEISTPDELSLVGSGGAYPADGEYVLTNDIDFTNRTDLNGGFDITVKATLSGNEVTISLYIEGKETLIESSEDMLVSLNGEVRKIAAGTFMETFTIDAGTTTLDIVAGGLASNAPTGMIEYSAIAVTMELEGSGASKRVNSNGNMDPLSQDGSFTGKLHGNGYKIIGLNISTFSTSDAYSGLFARVTTPNADGFDGLWLDRGSTVSVAMGVQSHVGGLIGSVTNAVTVTGCQNTGAVTAASYDGISSVGGLVGKAFNKLTISNSYTEGAVSSTTSLLTSALAYAGGLAGSADGDVDITGSHTSGNMTSTGATSFTGGLVNYIAGSVKIDKSYTTGNMTSTGYNTMAGGFVANVYGNAIISDSYATGNMTAESSDYITSAYAGGLAGKVGGFVNITDSHTSGDVTATVPYIDLGAMASAGGLVSYVIGDVDITGSYTTGDVTSTGCLSFAGGLVEYTDGKVTITGSYTTGDVTSTGFSSFAGGLVDTAIGEITITVSHTTGDVTAESIAEDDPHASAGGFIAVVESADVTITDSHTSGNVKASALSALTITPGFKLVSSAGGLVGYVDTGNVTVTGCYTEGEIKSTSLFCESYAGGLGGIVIDGNVTVTDSHTGGAVTSESSDKSYAGGLVGGVDGDMTVTGSYTDGDVKSSSSIVTTSTAQTESYAGGLAGNVSGSVNIYDSHTTGDVISITTTTSLDLTSSTSYSYTGGLVGNVSGSVNIYDSHTTGDASSTSTSTSTSTSSSSSLSTSYSYAGGFIGNVSGAVTVIDSHTTGDASSTSTSTLTSSLSTSTSTSHSYAGGFIGNVSGSVNIYDSHTTGDLTASSTSTSSSYSYSYSYAGGLVGDAYGIIVVTGSHTTGNMRANCAGGLVGGAGGVVTIIDSYTTGDVTSSTSSSYAGGLVGNVSGAVIVIDSYTTGEVSSSSPMSYSYAGGLVGYASGDVIFTGSYTTGNVKSSLTASSSLSSYAGGLIGRSNAALTITHCYSEGDVSSIRTLAGMTVPNAYAGGLVAYGNADTTITDCKSYGAVAAYAESADGVKPSYAGGLAGYINGLADMTDCYTYGNVSATTHSGGLVGYSTSLSAERGGTTGEVSAEGGEESYVGGLAGHIKEDASIRYCFTTGRFSVLNLSGSMVVGGLIGLVEGMVTVSNSWTGGTLSTAPAIIISAGGLIGGAGSGVNISDSFATGRIQVQEVENYARIGGLVGATEGNVIISQSAVTGSIDITVADDYCDTFIGGLVAFTDGNVTVTDCYITGDITVSELGSGGNSRTGGIVSLSKTVTATNCYITGNLMSDGICAAVITLYDKNESSYITNCYFLKTADINPLLELYTPIAGKVYIDGVLQPGTARTEQPSGGLPLEDLLLQSSYYSGMTLTYDGWDFTAIWGIDESSAPSADERFNGGLPFLIPSLITEQPQDVTSNYVEGNTFRVGVSIEPAGYQWQKYDGSGWVDIDGAEYAEYVTTSDDAFGDVFRCVITLWGSETVTSGEAYLYGVHMDVSIGGNGAVEYEGIVISGSGGKIKDIGVTSIEFTLLPDAEYKLVSVTLDGINITSGVRFWKFTVDTTRDHTLTVVFGYTSISYDIDSSVNDTAGGTIEPLGKTVLTETWDQTYIITSNDGYVISKIIVDGVPRTPKSPSSVTYVFENVTDDHTIEAVFVESFIITASVNDSTMGSITPSGETAVLPGGSQEFRFEANPGYTVYDVLVNSASIGAVTHHIFDNVTSDQAIKVIFAMEFIITASVNDDTYGTIEPSGTVPVTEGDDRKFTITPNDGYMVYTVTVDDEDHHGNYNEWTFNGVNDNHDINVTFGPAVYIFSSIDPESGGYIEPAGRTAVKPGDAAAFNIQAAESYRILDVVVDGGSVGPLSEYTFDDVTVDHTIKAFFVKVFTISASVNDESMGTIDPSSEVKVDYGSDKTFTISAKDGYMVYDVAVDGESAGAVYEYTFKDIKAAHSIHVTFGDAFAITASVNDDTMGSIDPFGEVKVMPGHDKKFTITPKDGYVISDVMVDGMSQGAISEYTFGAVTANHTIHVTFVKVFVISASVNDETMGSMDPTGEVVVPVGEGVTFTFTAKDGYMVYDVIIDGVSKGPSDDYTFPNVDEAHEIEVVFCVAHVIKASVNDTSMGSVDPSGDVQVPEGGNKTFTFTAKDGYMVYDVIVDGESKGAILEYTFPDVSEAHEIEVVFGVEYVITASVNDETMGSINPSGRLPTQAGDDVEFTFAPKDGYQLSDVIVDGVSKGHLLKFTFNNVSADHTIKAVFIKVFTIDASVNDESMGSIKPYGKLVVPAGDDVTFTATPERGYRVSKILVDGVATTENPYTLYNIQKDHMIEVIFELAVHDVTLKIVGEDGGTASITPEKVTVEDIVTVTVNVKDGYYAIVSSSYGNLERIDDTTYTLSDVDRDCTITVTFTETEDDNILLLIAIGTIISLTCAYMLVLRIRRSKL